jgi:hypothetical protein
MGPGRARPPPARHRRRPHRARHVTICGLRRARRRLVAVLVGTAGDARRAIRAAPTDDALLTRRVPRRCRDGARRHRGARAHRRAAGPGSPARRGDMEGRRWPRGRLAHLRPVAAQDLQQPLAEHHAAILAALPRTHVDQPPGVVDVLGPQTARFADPQAGAARRHRHHRRDLAGRHRSIQEPLHLREAETFGFFCGTFGHGILSATSWRSSVTPYRNFGPAACILIFSGPAPWRTICPR